MQEVFRRQPRTRQPQGAAAITTGPFGGPAWWMANPLLSGVSAEGSIAGLVTTKTGSSVTVGPSLGSAYDPPGLTLLGLAVINGTTYNQQMQGLVHLAASPGPMGLLSYGYLNNAQLRAQIQHTDYTTSNTGDVAHGVSTNGGVLCAALTYRRNTVGGLRLFVNGRLLAAVDTLDKTIHGGFANWKFASTNGAGRDYQQALGVIWERALRDSDVAKLTTNPWQLFAPEERRIWVPPSGAVAGVPTLSAATVISITQTQATPRVTLTF